MTTTQPVHFSRRRLLGGAAAVSVAAMWPTSPFGAGAAGAQGIPGPATQPVLVNICLRGGADGLALVPPLGDPSHQSLRGALGETSGIAFDGIFSLHDSFASLLNSVPKSEIAVVHAVHSDDPTQSHFAAIDLSDAGNEFGGGGWMGNAAAANGLLVPLNQVSIGTAVHPVLRSAASGVVIDSIEGVQAVGGSTAARRDALETMYTLAPDRLNEALGVMFDGIDASSGLSVDLGNYPRNNFEGPALREAAALIKADIGVANVAINSGNVANGGRWDTHSYQKSILPGMVGDLAQGLAAFREDLGEHWDRTIVLIQSEFGRSLNAEEYTGTGTQHGKAGAFILCGGPLASGAGGRVLGTWLGLGDGGVEYGNTQTYLKKTTDTRTVLRELLWKHMGYRDVDSMFPTFDAAANPELGLLPRRLFGDVDDNGVLDGADAQAILDSNVGKTDPISPLAGDVNGDGRVTLMDALLAARGGGG